MKKMMMVMAATIGALGACYDDHSWSHYEVLHLANGPWYIQYDNGHPLAAASSDPFILSKEDELLDLINNHRVSRGLPALIDDSDMRDVARAHSIHMAMAWFEDTVNPEGDDPGDRLRIAGIPWTLCSENIAYDEHFTEAFSVYNQWLDDPGRHDNIDDPEFVYAGVGYEHDAPSIYNNYWTMDFRQP